MCILVVYVCGEGVLLYPLVSAFTTLCYLYERICDGTMIVPYIERETVWFISQFSLLTIISWGWQILVVVVNDDDYSHFNCYIHDSLITL